jgi:hypothetical protein
MELYVCRKRTMNPEMALIHQLALLKTIVFNLKEGLMVEVVI